MVQQKKESAPFDSPKAFRPGPLLIKRNNVEEKKREEVPQN